MKLDLTQAAGVPEEKQADVAYRMSQMETCSPRCYGKWRRFWQRTWSRLGGQVTEVGGVEAVAEMLNRTGRSTEMSVLDRLDALDPEAAEEIRNKMFTFNEISELNDQEVRMILQEVDKKDLAIALKGATDEMRDWIFANVSERVAKTIKKGMEFSGPVRNSEVEEVQLRIVQKVREPEEVGQMKIVRVDTGDTYL